MLNIQAPSPLRRGPPKTDSTELIPRRQLQSVLGKRIDLPDRGRLVHLQFRRFSGCPVCNLHLRSFVRAHDELTAAGIQEVVVFHSSVEDLRPYATDLPFAVIADPGKALYMEFGVKDSLRSLLDPRVWGTIIVAISYSLVAIARHGQPRPSLTPRGGRFGLPADFLIAPDGRVLAHNYGTHANDQWSVAELLSIARKAHAATDHRHDP